MKKFTCCLTATAFVVGLLAIATQAAPPNMTKKQSRAALERQRGFNSLNVVSAGTQIETTGFETTDGWATRDADNSGFICGPAFNSCSLEANTGACPQPGGNCCIGDPNPDTGWYTSISSEHCREPHIDTANPATGTQHLRFTRASGPAGGHPDGCVGFTAVECRQTAFSPDPFGTVQLATGNDTVSVDIASTGRGSSSAIVWWINDTAAVGTVAQVTFDYYGDIIVRDYTPGQGYVTTGTVWLPGAYATLRIEIRNCDDVTDYFYGKNTDGTDRLIFSHTIGSLFGGNVAGINRSILMTDNAGEIWDMDNYSVVRGDPCPTTCGEFGIEPGEQCDFGEGEDFLCPGKCVPAGETGPGGEIECSCIIPGENSCEAVELENGQTVHNGEGGWYTFIADAPGTAIDMCDELGFDSYLLFAYNPIDDACDLGSLYLFPPFFNDDCNINDPDYGFGTDPLASCHPVGSFPWQACGCMPTVIGERYWVWERRGGALGSERTINKTKRLSCDAVWDNGACCRGETGVCEDDVAPEDCTSACDTYTHNKLCGGLGACDAVLGSCCDAGPGAGGACVNDVFGSTCEGEFQTWSCGDCDGTCTEIDGACCDKLDGFCSVTLRDDCSGAQPEWTVGSNCTEVTCDPALGACCNTRLGTCTDDIILADCGGANLSWTKGGVCSPTTCPDPFIPTVSQWGLAIMTLLLLIGAKVYFGRREALA